MCELPKYPSSDPNSSGPLTLAYSDTLGYLVACGSDRGSKDCYSFDGITWLPLPSLQDYDLDSPAYATNSFFMKDGLWLGAGGDFYQEVLTLLGWFPVEANSPPNYGDGPCAIPVNSTHIFFSGWGTSTEETWLLELDMEDLLEFDLTWTSLTPMLTPRGSHGCGLNADGEVVIAGGFYGNNYVNSVHTFNPVSLEWRESGNVPAEMFVPVFPSLLLWKDTVILIESDTGRIWEKEGEQGWRLLEVMVDDNFNGYDHNAVIVPDSWRDMCQ